MRRLSKFQNALLTVGAVAGTLCLLAALAGVLFGVKPLMFKSGSMEPTIPTGGLALSIPVDGNDIRVGDIVSTENATGTRITHRVTAVEPASGYTGLILKGDANDIVDAEIYAVTEADRVFWSAPLLGYVVAWSSSPLALFLGGLFTAYLLYVAFGSRSRGGQPTPTKHGSGIVAPASRRRVARPTRRRSKGMKAMSWSTSGVAILGCLAITGGSLYAAGPARAWFTDSATYAAQITAGSLAAPVITCTDMDDGQGVSLAWPYTVLPIAATFTVTWRKASSETWEPWTGEQTVNTVGETQVNVLASTLDDSMLALAQDEIVYFRVQAISGEWSSALGEAGTQYTAPVEVVFVGLSDPTLNCQ